MGLSSITNRAIYIGDGSSTVFPFPFYFFNPNDLAVYLFDTGSSVIYPQVINTNYTISGNVSSQGVYPSGGSVVMASSFPSNLEIVIARNPSQVQNYVLNQNGPINSLGLVQQLDYVTALVQRLQDQVSRCIQLPDGYGTINGSGFSTVLPSNIGLSAVSSFAPIVVNSGATGLQLGFVVGSSSFAGIVPVAQGGTGRGGFLTPFGVWYSLGSSIMAQTPAGAPGQVLLGQGSSAPIWGSTPIGSGAVIIGSGTVISQGVMGILPLTNGGTGVGATSASAAFNALSPMTTGGDIIVGSGGGVAMRLAGGSATQVLTSNGPTALPSWQALAGVTNINMRYHNASGTLGSGFITYGSKDFETNNSSYLGGVFTIPTTGKYMINATIKVNATFALNNNTILQLNKNGFVFSRNTNISGGATTSMETNISDIFNFTSGDTLTVSASCSGSATSIPSDDNANYISLTFIGT